MYILYFQSVLLIYILFSSIQALRAMRSIRRTYKLRYSSGIPYADQPDVLLVCAVGMGIFLLDSWHERILGVKDRTLSWSIMFAASEFFMGLSFQHYSKDSSIRQYESRRAVILISVSRSNQFVWKPALHLALDCFRISHSGMADLSLISGNVILHLFCEIAGSA